MNRLRLVLATCVTALVGVLGASLALVSQASAAPTVDGVEWRELYLTTGLSRDQIAGVCPVDGASPCAGAIAGIDLAGWVWGSADQVRGLLDDYAPELTAANTVVGGTGGTGGFVGAVGLLGVMRYTTYTSLTYFYSEYTSGWTASVDTTGVPIVAGAQFETALTGGTSSGAIGLSAEPGSASSTRGVWLCRPTVVPPVPTSTTTSMAVPETTPSSDRCAPGPNT